MNYQKGCVPWSYCICAVGGGERMRNSENENTLTAAFFPVLTHKRKPFLDPLRSDSGCAIS